MTWGNEGAVLMGKLETNRWAPLLATGKIAVMHVNLPLVYALTFMFGASTRTAVASHLMAAWNC